MEAQHTLMFCMMVHLVSLEKVVLSAGQMRLSWRMPSGRCFGNLSSHLSERARAPSLKPKEGRPRPLPRMCSTVSWRRRAEISGALVRRGVSRWNLSAITAKINISTRLFGAPLPYFSPGVVISPCISACHLLVSSFHPSSWSFYIEACILYCLLPPFLILRTVSPCSTLRT